MVEEVGACSMMFVHTHQDRFILQPGASGICKKREQYCCTKTHFEDRVEGYFMYNVVISDFKAENSADCSECCQNLRYTGTSAVSLTTLQYIYLSIEGVMLFYRYINYILTYICIDKFNSFL